uniref:Si:dkey-88e18.2 n=2 Tax=Astyanax mexicanus TaxID=7994 RepID=A0A8B9HCS5_ASTMX
MSRMSSALSAICIVFLGIMRVSAVDTFPKKFVAVQMNSDVTLHCDTTDQDVTWQYDSDELEASEDIRLEGNKLILKRIEEEQAGNYTCWRNNEIVDYTYVLLDMTSHITDLTINCTAETFNCTFNISCNMNQPAFNYFRLRNKRDNSNWVMPSEDGAFHLTHSTNPYAEEAKQLEVIGEAVSSSDRYFKISHNFYLRDIIKPACPEVSVNKRKVNLAPPPTWAKPTSYYPLDHEIQCKNLDDGKEKPCDLDHDNKVPKGTSELRVRCRDSLLLSQWSDWTPWHNVSH